MGGRKRSGRSGRVVREGEERREGEEGKINVGRGGREGERRWGRKINGNEKWEEEEN